MKLPQLNNDNSRLHVFIKGSCYSYPLYKDFKSMKDLCKYMKEEFYCTRKDFDYFYSR